MENMNTPPHVAETGAISRRALLAGAALAVVAGAGAAYGFARDDLSGHQAGRVEFETLQTHDMLRQGSWEFMPGVEKLDEDGIQIVNTRLTVRKAQSEWRNPGVPERFAVVPVNAWAHVEMEKPGGDIGFSARLSGINGKATLLFQSRPTFRYDERIHVHPGIGVEVENDTVTTKIWLGTSEHPDIVKRLQLGIQSSNVSLALMQASDALSIHANGELLRIPDVNVFDSGQVWFGMDASHSWWLSDFRASDLGGNRIEVFNSRDHDFGALDPEGLQARVARNRPDLLVGTAIDLIPLTSDPAYAELVMEQFGGLTTEMLAKPQNLQPERAYFVWHELRAFVDLATRHDKQMHLHTLVFGEANPPWLEQALADASSAEALQLLREVIEPVLTEFKGQFATIDVVNEPFHPYNWGELRNNVWHKALGKQYIAEAFRIAHAADPDALLFLNDWALEHDPDRWATLINLLKELQADEVPIHGIGFQAHLDAEDITELMDPNILAERFAQLEAMGLKVRVSEISVEGEDQELQAQAYAKILRTCTQAGNCVGFTMWGAASNETYFTTWPNADYKVTPEQYGNDASWQKAETGTYIPKPAAKALLDAASE